MFILRHTPSFFVLLCLTSFFSGFLVLAYIWSLLQYSLGYDPFCLGFSGTCLDSIPHLSHILQYSPRYDLFFGTRPNSIPCLSCILRYSLIYNLFFGTCPNTILSVLDSSILARIRSSICLVFFGTSPNIISSPASCLDFLGFSDTRLDLIPFPLVYFGIVSGSLDLF